MRYSSQAIRQTFDEIVEQEDSLEKARWLRNAVPRAFMRKYLQESDVVLDAGGGSGINAILLAQHCQAVTLLDIAPKMLERAAANIQAAGVQDRIRLLEGDITRLGALADGSFSFVVCTGGVLSFLLERAEQALSELVRVARPGAVLVIGCESQLGALRFYLGREGPAMLAEVRQMQQTGVYEISEYAKARLFSADELRKMLQNTGCEVLEMASTPVLIPWGDESKFKDDEQWQQLLALELEVCTAPELLGCGYYLLCVARKK